MEFDSLQGNYPMKLTQILLFIASVSFLSGCIVIAKTSHAKYHSQQTLKITADKLNALDVEAGAGALIIEGDEAATEISVVADIYTKNGDIDNVELSLIKAGKSANLVAKIDSNGFWHGESPRIDIKVIMPSHLMLNVDDGSGAININNIDAKVAVKDGSGELSIKNVKNDLKINDGSGGIYISGVIGNVKVIDGSGEISLNDLDGNLDIDDGSGSIFVNGVSGDVMIKDGSGELIVRSVNGFVTIDDGSGDIDIEQAGGLKIINSGSGDMRVNKVKGVF